jgi:hypothetical protein
MRMLSHISSHAPLVRSEQTSWEGNDSTSVEKKNYTAIPSIANDSIRIKAGPGQSPYQHPE